MKLKFEQLAFHLEKNLLPIYLISGEEALLLEEARHLLFKAAKQKEFLNREQFTIEKGFDWQALALSNKNRSLFAQKTLIELHLNSLKLDSVGKDILGSFCKTPPKDKLIVIITGKLDAAAQKASWIKNIETNGAIIQIWPIEPSRLGTWVMSRLKQNGLDADLQTAKFIADATEGNLLASAQEILKLKLLYGAKKITLDEAAYAISSNTSFNVFNLVDYLLQENYSKAIAIINDLKKDGMEPILVLWALAREIRLLLNLKIAILKNEDLEHSFTRFKVWPKQQPLVNRALKKHSEKSLTGLLQKAAEIDTIIKGVAPGQVWLKLLELAISI